MKIEYVRDYKGEKPTEYYISKGSYAVRNINVSSILLLHNYLKEVWGRGDFVWKREKSSTPSLPPLPLTVRTLDVVPQRYGFASDRSGGVSRELTSLQHLASSPY